MARSSVPQKTQDAPNTHDTHDKNYLRQRYGFNEKQALGTGCFGTVYRAQDAWDDRPVAIKKQLRLPWNAAEHNVQMQLTHPNILRAHDEALGRWHQYLITDLGTPIDPKAVTVAQARVYMQHLLDGLAYTHDMGVSHRDLKLGNVLARDGALQVIDYGKAGFHLSQHMHDLCAKADIARACQLFGELLQHCSLIEAAKFRSWYKGQPTLSIAQLRDHPIVNPYSVIQVPPPQRTARATWPLRKALYTTAMLFPLNFRPTFVLPYRVRPGQTRLPDTPVSASIFTGAPPSMLPSAWVSQRFQVARASTQQAPKSTYLSQFNRDIAPLLTSELAALERLAMQNCRLHMRGDERFAMNIQTDCQGNPAQDYAPEYTFERFICTQHGCRALVLTPSPEHPSGNSIVCIAGIACHPDGMRDRHEGRGYRTLADRPIGRRAYVQGRHALQQALDTLLQRDGDITIVGHSLGGTVAMLWVADLPPETQARIRLITLGTPKVPRATADKIVAGKLKDARGLSRSIRVWVEGDRFAHFGKSAPVGTWCMSIKPTQNSVETHRTPLLGDSQIDGSSLVVAHNVPMPGGNRVAQSLARGSYKFISCFTPR